MRSLEITEASPVTVSGSFSSDLLISKLWLWQELVAVLDRLDIDRVHAVYVLGSWTGVMGLVLAARQFPANTIINVDLSPRWTRVNRILADRLGVQDQMQYMTADANHVNYRQIRSPSVVINTSTNDILGDRWFKHIPPGTIVACQGRNAADPSAARSWHSLQAFAGDFPLDRTLYRGQLGLRDPETAYDRYMIIGTV